VREIFVASDNIITSLGYTTEENVSAFNAGQTGIKLHEDDRISPSPFWASRVDSLALSDRFSEYANPAEFTRFEQLLICSAKDALKRIPINPSEERTLFILSTTKGNIDILDQSSGSRFDNSRVYLWHSAKLLQQFFNLFQTPVVVSNACISGVLAIMIGARYIRSGRYDHVIITGADLVTEFVLSGFNSFLSLSTGPCKPFDKERQGLSLGEGAGTVILTSNRELSGYKDNVKVGPGFSSNDANHISGPSRTAEGLYIAIKRTLGIEDGRLQISDDRLQKAGHSVDYISAHGTATPYNDEMESIALTRAGLQDVPVNSFKGYFGHTLGAAGVIESVSGIYSMRHDLLFNTKGFNTIGVKHPIAVINETRKSKTDTFLKIASGFGGCNASLLFYK
jgi:3-oxoacyl-[acyl-carrier-protein] synthase I